MKELSELWPDKSDDLLVIAQRLQKLILRQSDQIREDVGGGAKVKMSLYSIGAKDNVLAAIDMGKDHCKLYLHHTDKVNTEGLLLKGKGKHAKTLWISSLDEISEKILEEVLAQITKIALEKA
ncbi:MAG: DUF1801 domain-containing protein [Bacteroidota bacterium]